MIDIKNDIDYETEIFSQIEIVGQKISNSSFEHCNFSGCDFSESEFIACRFIECEFKDSNFNVTKLTGSRLLESRFENCKLTGINWTSLSWTGITVSAPMTFEFCDLSFSVFHSLSLPGLIITNGKAWNADFEDCDLTHAKFTNTDLKDARFNRTKLNMCDFSEATNYYIDPNSNSMVGASFSFPEVINLLAAFDINVKGPL